MRSDHTETVDVDVTKLPGYQSIPASCPLWKKAMIEKKNKQLEEDAMVIETAVDSVESFLHIYCTIALQQSSSDCH